MALLNLLLGDRQSRDDTLIQAIPGVRHQPLRGPISVNSDTAMTVTAAYRCVTLLADTIGSLPLHQYRNGQMIDPSPALVQPERDRTRMDSIATLISSAIMRGNGYAVVSSRDYLGYPTSYVVTSPDAVQPFTDPRDGQLRYRIGTMVYDRDDVLHVRGYTPPGAITGMGVIELQRRTLGQAIAGEDYAAELFTTGATPDVVISSEVELTADEAAELKADFIAANGGRQRGPAVLQPGLDFKPLAWSNVDLEALESRKWNAVQVCQMFGVQPILAGVPSGESKTYQNVQQDTAMFVKFTLRGWLTRLESAFSMHLPRGNEARFNIDALLRADTLERYQAHEIGIRAGFLERNEAREFEGRPPLANPDPMMGDTDE